MTRYQFTNQHGDEEIHRAEGFTDWAWSDPEQAARVRQLVQDEQYRTWVKSLPVGETDMNIDVKGIGSIIVIAIVGIMALFVAIVAPVLHYDVPNTVAVFVIGAFSAVMVMLGIGVTHSAVMSTIATAQANVLHLQGTAKQ